MNLKKEIYIDLLLIFLLINFSTNLIFSRNTGLNSLNVYVFLSLFLVSTFFYFLSVTLNRILNFDSRSFSLVVFLLSFYLVDSLFVIILKEINFDITFYFVSFFWICLLIKNLKNNFQNIFLTISAYLIMRFFNTFLFEKIKTGMNYKELNGDVNYQWLPSVKKIYEDSYAFSFTNNLVESQGLMPSYTQALIHKLNFNLDSFIYLQTNSLIFIIFSIFLFSEIKTTRKIKIKISLIYIILIINNEWLFYLIGNSLMLEGQITYLFSVFLFILKNQYTNFTIQKRNIFWLFFGTIVFTKQFVSIISLLIFIIIIIFKLEKISVMIFSFVPLLVDYLNKYYFKLSTSFVTYNDGFNLADIFLSFTEKGKVEYSNFLNILNTFYKDKPSSLLIVIMLVLLFQKLRFNNLKFIDSVYESTSILNFFLVVFLYLTYWKNIEVESSYRYLIIFLNIYFLSLVNSLNKEN